jgi:molybdopterin-guanine dinucleotide biosynthesis protein A
MTLDAVVLAGGRGRRLGGVDKAALVVGATSTLDRVLGALVDSGRVVVSGPDRPGLTSVQESPPDGGPVAGLAAALPLLDAELIAVLACDLPLVTAEAVRALAMAVDGHDGALLVDAEGRAQPLCAVYRTSALRSAVTSVGEVHGASMRSLVATLDLVELEDRWAASADVDTDSDLDRVRMIERSGDLRP